jgi:hypothetical protein
MIELRNDLLQNIKYFTNKINSHRQNYKNYEIRNTDQVEDECALRTVREGCLTSVIYFVVQYYAPMSHTNSYNRGLVITIIYSI